MSSMIAYLIEIRQRLIRCCIVLGVLLAIALIFANKIYYYLALPLVQHISQQNALIATAVPAPLLVPFKSALVLSIYLAIPYLLYQLWGFIAPALYKQERKLTWLLMISSALLFYMGTLFAYFVVLPLVFKFFLYIAPAGVEVKPDISLYFSFIVKLFLAFGASFEVPVAVVLLTYTGMVKVESLEKKRPYVIVAAFVLGMVLTPPDVISQILLAVPLWLLFELGLFMSRRLLSQVPQKELS